MARKKKDEIAELLSQTPVDVALAHAVEVFSKQGFVRSGETYTKYDEAGNEVGIVFDNKTSVIKRIQNGTPPADESFAKAKEISDRFNGRFLMKKLTDDLTDFEKSAAAALEGPLSSFYVAVLSSLPHMAVVDSKRREVEDRLELVRYTSEYFGVQKQRYDIEVEVIDVKFIQSMGVYMVTTLFNDRDIIKFWWREQPDLTDILDGKTIAIRGTVNKHEESKFSNGAKETLMNRVKILRA